LCVPNPGAESFGSRRHFFVNVLRFYYYVRKKNKNPAESANIDERNEVLLFRRIAVLVRS